MRTLLVLVLLLPSAAAATPVKVPPLRGLPIIEPAQPVPPPPCLDQRCPQDA